MRYRTVDVWSGVQGNKGAERSRPHALDNIESGEKKSVLPVISHLSSPLKVTAAEFNAAARCIDLT